MITDKIVTVTLKVGYQERKAWKSYALDKDMNVVDAIRLAMNRLIESDKTAKPSESAKTEQRESKQTTASKAESATETDESTLPMFDKEETK